MGQNWEIWGKNKEICGKNREICEKKKENNCLFQDWRFYPATKVYLCY